MKKLFYKVGPTDWDARNLISPFAYYYEKGRSNPLRTNVALADSWSEADIVAVPMSVRYYASRRTLPLLDNWIEQAAQDGKSVVVYNGGDLAIRLPRFPHVLELRPSGYRSRSHSNQCGFPFMLSDQLQAIYNRREPSLRKKSDTPIVGFCGQASYDVAKLAKDALSWSWLNAKSWAGVAPSDPEPFYLSAWHRSALLSVFERSRSITTNFLKRRRYRGGAATEFERARTTREYFDNMIESDYIVCVRGSGNFSLRLYETLMMGRIPVFINTDCLLPFEDVIDWKHHVVWIEYADRHKAPEIVRAFHDRLSSSAFTALQRSNRRLWEDYMNVEQYLRYVSKWQSGSALSDPVELPAQPRLHTH